MGVTNAAWAIFAIAILAVIALIFASSGAMSLDKSEKYAKYDSLQPGYGPTYPKHIDLTNNVRELTYKLPINEKKTIYNLHDELLTLNEQKANEKPYSYYYVGSCTNGHDKLECQTTLDTNRFNSLNFRDKTVPFLKITNKAPYPLEIFYKVDPNSKEFKDKQNFNKTLTKPIIELVGTVAVGKTHYFYQRTNKLAFSVGDWLYSRQEKMAGEMEYFSKINLDQNAIIFGDSQFTYDPTNPIRSATNKVGTLIVRNRFNDSITIGYRGNLLATIEANQEIILDPPSDGFLPDKKLNIKPKSSANRFIIIPDQLANKLTVGTITSKFENFRE